MYVRSLSGLGFVDPLTAATAAGTVTSWVSDIFGKKEQKKGPAWNRLQAIRVGESWEPNMVAVDQKAVNWINPSWLNDLQRGVAGSVIWQNAPSGSFERARQIYLSQQAGVASTAEAQVGLASATSLLPLVLVGGLAVYLLSRKR